jgi:hypothetical protein
MGKNIEKELTRVFCQAKLQEGFGAASASLESYLQISRNVLNGFVTK